MSFGFMGCDPTYVWPEEQRKGESLPPELGTRAQAGDNVYVLVKAGQNLGANEVVAMDAGDFEVNNDGVGNGAATIFCVTPLAVASGTTFWGLIEGRGVPVRVAGADRGDGPFIVNNAGQIANGGSSTNNKISGIVVRQANGNTRLCDVWNPQAIGR